MHGCWNGLVHHYGISLNFSRMSPTNFLFAIFPILFHISRSNLASASDIPSKQQKSLVPAIVDGRPAAPYRFKWMASLQRSGQHTCGAVLLTNDLVISAAHCLTDPFSLLPISSEDIRIFVGSRELNSSGLLIPVANFTLHPGFRRRNPTLQSDIALIRLKHSVAEVWRDHTEHIFLPLAHNRYGPLLQAVGWGYTDSQNRVVAQALRAVNLTEIDAVECRARFDDGIDITQAILCTDSSNGDICQGDSGGPLISDTDPVSGYHIDTLVGIISMSSHRCGMNASASLHTNVSHFLDFLHAEMGPTEVNRSRWLFLEKITNEGHEKLLESLETHGKNHSTTTHTPSPMAGADDELAVNQGEEIFPRASTEDDEVSTTTTESPRARSRIRTSSVVSIRIKGQRTRHVCTGTLISVDRFLTAASCFYDELDKPITAERVTVVVGLDVYGGQHPSQEIAVTSIVKYKGYVPYRYATRDANVAVLRLASSIADLPDSIRDTITVAELPLDEGKTGDYLQGPDEHGYWLMSTGWNGDAGEAPRYPRSKNQTILPPDACRDRVKNHFTRVTAQVICTVGVEQPCHTNLHSFAPVMPRVSFAADMGSPLMAVRSDPDSGAVIETVLGVTTIFTDQCSRMRTHAPVTNIYVRVSGPIRKFVEEQLQSGRR